MVEFERLGADAIASKGWWQAYKWLLLRRCSQLLILALFLLSPWLYREHGVSLLKGNLSSSMLLDTVPMTEPLVFLQMVAAGFITPVAVTVTGLIVVVLSYLLVGGRVYCSWVCPLNIVTDAANWLRERLGVSGATRLPRTTRYWMLGMVVVLALVTGGMAYELLNPVSVVHRSIIFSLDNAGVYVGVGLAWLMVVAIFLFDLLLAKRGWCSHLCPMGASYGLIGKFSLIRVRAEGRTKCNDCLECFVVCPEPQVIKPALKGGEKGIGPVILAGECTNCGRCIDICAKEVFQLGTRFNNVERGAGT